MSEEIDKYVLRKYEIVSKLGKGMRASFMRLLRSQRYRVSVLCPLFVRVLADHKWTKTDKKERVLGIPCFPPFSINNLANFFQKKSFLSKIRVNSG